MSTMLSRLATPIRSQNVRIEPAVKPRRRKPDSVGMRGSSQPLTCPPSTSSSSTRLLITV